MEAEARIACRLSHPNIVATRNADWIDGRFVMASELAQGHVYDYRPRLALGPRGAAHRARRGRRARARALALAHAPRREARERAGLRGRSRGADRLRCVALHAAPSRAATPRPARWATWRRSRRTASRRSASDVFSLGRDRATSCSPGSCSPGRFPGRPSATTASPRRCPSRCGRCCDAPARSTPPTAIRRPSSCTPRSRRRSEASTRRARSRAAAPPAARAAPDADTVRGRHGSVPPPPRPRARHALPLPPLQRPDRRGDERLSVVRHEGQLVRRDHARAADLSALRARRAARVDELPVVLRGPLPRQRPAAAPRSARGAPLHAARLPGRAAPVHALLPGVQAEARPRLEPPRSARALPALSLADVARASGASAPGAAGASARIVDNVYFQW